MNRQEFWMIKENQRDFRLDVASDLDNYLDQVE